MTYSFYILEVCAPVNNIHIFHVWVKVFLVSKGTMPFMIQLSWINSVEWDSTQNNHLNDLIPTRCCQTSIPWSAFEMAYAHYKFTLLLGLLGITGTSWWAWWHLKSRAFRSKKTTTLRVTGLWVENSPVISEFPVQKTSNAEYVSIWWRHRVICAFHKYHMIQLARLGGGHQRNHMAHRAGGRKWHLWKHYFSYFLL